MVTSITGRFVGIRTLPGDPMPDHYDLDPQLLTPIPQNESGTCRICGCTEADCSWCVERTGRSCHWLNSRQTLCSACGVEASDPIRPGQRRVIHEAERDHEFIVEIDKQTAKDVRYRVLDNPAEYSMSRKMFEAACRAADTREEIDR